MSLVMCRLCLSKDNLGPIFLNNEKSEQYSKVLELTTGLKIEANDGLPQVICQNCTHLVNNALDLRNQSQATELELLKLGYKRIKNGNIPELKDNAYKTENSNEIYENPTQDCFDFDGFKIEVELDRISENENGDELQKQRAEDKQPSTKTVKDKRAMYMELVDGNFNPQGPVKCKVCKKTVSKWACFISHAKKHLGFKFVCEYCGKSFISSTQLKRHCRSYHGMEKDLKCKHCSYLALDKPQLVVHERRSHTGERPFVCDVCAAAYYSRKCLVQHIETHRTTATVQCPSCPQLFKSRRHLAKHRYSAHGGKSLDRRRKRRRQAAIDNMLQ